MTIVPPGTIPERKPRPLTEEERTKLFGGEIASNDLEKLAAKFAKPKRVKAEKVQKPNTGGWGK